MALISCISCGAKISDKAFACPKCGWTNQSETPLANNEELRIEKERKAAEEQRIEEERKAAEELRIEKERKAAEEQRIKEERKAYEELRIEEERKAPKEEGKVIRFFQVCFWLVVFFIINVAILGSLPDSTWVECGEKYWDYDRERYVRKKC